MKFQNFLFDLDGTLTDSGPGIINSILYALQKFGLPAVSRESLQSFLGPPLIDSFQHYCGVSAEEAETLVRYYREYFTEKGIFENSLYPGIRATLEALKARGAVLCLATSKPEPFAIQIIRHFKLESCFSFIGGSTLDETRTAKEEVIAYVLEKGLLRPEQTLMVGDRRYDIEGARKCGLQVAAVLYGYGGREELAAADYLIESPEALLEI